MSRRATSLSRLLVPMAVILLACAITAITLAWINRTLRIALAQQQAVVAQAAQLEAVRQNMGRMIAESAVRNRDQALADLVNAQRAAVAASMGAGTK